ncbi:hypothetical protein GCM10023195_76610 [Actinoallomurus liliacearum]|uniref:Uncharacterized protein n=1 Tax=Actinoallomurus liliacearum TaxID=1080073 RepID=A0ABP8TXF5_9ACTN
MIGALLIIGAALASGDKEDWKRKSDLRIQAKQLLLSPISVEEQAELELELSRSGSEDPRQNGPLGHFAWIIAKGISTEWAFQGERTPEHQVQLASIATVAAERAAASLLQKIRVAKAAKAVAAAKATQDPERMRKLALRSAKFLSKTMERHGMVGGLYGAGLERSLAAERDWRAAV